MKNIFHRIAATTFTAITLFCTATNAQTPAPPAANSLLWEISGNGLKKPSYVFGTIHMICEDDFEIKDKVKKALKKADNYVVEADVFSAESMKAMQEGSMSAVPQSKRLSAAQFATVDSILKLKAGVSLQQLETLKLSSIGSFLVIKTFACPTMKYYETELLKMSKERNMPFLTLETVQEQMSFYEKSYSDSFSIEQMKVYDQYKGMMDQLVKDYKQENLSALHEELTEDKFMDNNSLYWMLEVRNKNWAEKMPVMMKKGSNFFAVGAAHLSGKHGILGMLQAKGYTVRPIMN
ncbi:TraB/GumN family protein [Chitinophaga nivalis]|uniref:TraB/GumN family protein n=1 Tax=Chitinophaga nivalis TaxID=2991709 RepID=A0ABT3IEQ8_9BACT|nr:TraB/GumN family protein [Chitinophaga nivalis]MCW3467867.1 TraB/GumN family protein [Chitinophaga nivalis]MCW3482442.1 TraB/GumN family protein [Chitinophaga nivalis]